MSKDFSPNKTVNLQPTINFPIDYNKVYYDYTQGHFNRPIPHHCKLIVNHKSLTIRNNLTLDQNRERFNIPQTGHCIMITSNHIDYTAFYDNNNVTDIENFKYRCLYCSRDIKNKSVGIPYVSKHQRKRHGRNFYSYTLFYYHGHFCNYNCVWTYLITHNKCDPDTHTAISNLLWLTRIIYPHKNLKILPNPAFLNIHGGAMNDEEFDHDALIYREHPAIIFAPLKMTSLISIK
jgi:hypothetical protein